MQVNQRMERVMNVRECVGRARSQNYRMMFGKKHGPNSMVERAKANRDYWMAMARHHKLNSSVSA